ncbi:unnamed protein product [Rotaria sp. Silwood1]|nr:unnamed protein product [Rotaria sp. Silwood1]CAF4952210.1 unnamed protein product [Rotaria sp. Silwood1]
MCDDNQLCRWYLEMKGYKFTTENLQHMDEYRHEKQKCRYGRECRAFNRLLQNGYRLDDIGHCSIYFHQGRRGGTTVEENFGSKKFITAYQNWGVDLPKGTGFRNGIVEDGQLIKELEKNNYAHVMTLTSGPYKTLNDVAREKLRHPRHRKMGSPLFHDQMLAVLLYTDTDIEKPKWPVLGSLLASAIWFLDENDNKPRPPTVYHGLNEIKIDPSAFNNYGTTKVYSENDEPVFKYGTFISTSWDEDVARAFSRGKGALLEIDLNTDSGIEPLIGADVSWISKFSSECEFLIARSATFAIKSIDISQDEDYQIVKVKEGPFSHSRMKFHNKYRS